MNTQTHENLKTWAGLKHSGRGPAHSNDHCQYWLEDGEIVSLEVYNRTMGNVEFSVNGLSNRHIWFSQLGEAFFDVNTLDLWGGEITFKDGRRQTIASVYNCNPYYFADVVKGKKFRVCVMKERLLFRFDRNIPGNNYGENRQFILNLLEQGKVQEALNYLNAAQGYNLYEV